MLLSAVLFDVDGTIAETESQICIKKDCSQDGSSIIFTDYGFYKIICQQKFLTIL